MATSSQRTCGVSCCLSLFILAHAAELMHDPSQCMPRGGTQGEADHCCTRKSDFHCGGGYEVRSTFNRCGESGSESDSGSEKFEFQCLPDNSEWPLGSVILVGFIVVACTVVVSILQCKYMTAKTTTCRKEKALFTPEDQTKLLQGKPLGKTLAESVSHSLRNSMISSTQSMLAWTGGEETSSASAGLPHLLKQTQHSTTEEKPKSLALTGSLASQEQVVPNTTVTLFRVVPHDSD